MKKILLAIMIAFLSFTNIFAYELTAKDERIIDKVETKIFTLIDSWKLDSQKLVDRIDYLIENRNLSDRLVEILYVISDDIQYEYYLWDYADEQLDNEDEYLADNFKEPEEAKQQENSWEKFDAVYKVDGNKIFLESWKEDEKYVEVFWMYANLIPEDFRKDIVEYKVYNKPDGDTFAYVKQMDNDKSKWRLIVNIGAFYKDWKIDFKESVHTLIHEYAHVLTLWKKQIDFNNFDNCPNYLVSEGCLNKDAYLNKFIENFWKKDFKASQESAENDFYTWKENNFVTEYAATNPWEDIAETFTYFVLKEKPKDSSLIKNQKILLFWKYKELVKLRNNIRKGLKSLEK